MDDLFFTCLLFAENIEQKQIVTFDKWFTIYTISDVGYHVSLVKLSYCWAKFGFNIQIKK